MSMLSDNKLSVTCDPDNENYLNKLKFATRIR